MEEMMRCECPTGQYFSMYDEASALAATSDEEYMAMTAGYAGKCVDIPPCGDGRRFLDLEYYQGCVDE